jgi:hypothetical protein
MSCELVKLSYLFDEQQVGFWPGIINFRTLSQILG